jgi:hypothetical protein
VMVSAETSYDSNELCDASDTIWAYSPIQWLVPALTLSAPFHIFIPHKNEQTRYLEQLMWRDSIARVWICARRFFAEEVEYGCIWIIPS